MKETHLYHKYYCCNSAWDQYIHELAKNIVTEVDNFNLIFLLVLFQFFGVTFTTELRNMTSCTDDKS